MGVIHEPPGSAGGRAVAEKERGGAIAAEGPRPEALAARLQLKECYELFGYASPLHGLAPAEVAAALEGFKRFEADHRDRVDKLTASIMNHVWLPWLRDLAKHPAILDAVGVVFGSRDIYLYSSQLFPRAPNTSLQSSMYIGWHRDSDFTPCNGDFTRLSPLDRRHFVTVLVALSACDVAHGCLHVRPTRPGREPDPEVRPLELRPGEFSMHGPSTLHTGGTNNTDDTRYCVALRYVKASTEDCRADQLGRDTALLVSGEDRNGNFDALPEVPGEATAEGQQLREEIIRRRRTACDDQFLMLSGVG